MKINNEEIKSFVIYGEDQGEIGKEFDNLEDCYNYIQELKRFDRRNEIEDKYYVACQTDKHLYGYYILYRRNSRYKLKPVV